MPRLYVFELPDGSTQLHLRAGPPAVGMTLGLLGREYVIVTVGDDRCTLELLHDGRSRAVSPAAPPFPGRPAGPLPA
jgi:hypothetical protein